MRRRSPREEGGEEHRERRGYGEGEVKFCVSESVGDATGILKIDIDNSAIEAQFLVSFGKVVDGTADVGAVVIEVVDVVGAVGQGGAAHARALGAAEARVPRYRLPQYLHQIDNPERFYTPCTSVRAFKFVLHVRSARPGVARAPPQGRPEGPPRHPLLVLSKERIGVGAEAWMSESMEATLPAMWRDAKCGGTDAEAAGAPKSA